MLRQRNPVVYWPAPPSPRASLRVPPPSLAPFLAYLRALRFRFSIVLSLSLALSPIVGALACPRRLWAALLSPLSLSFLFRFVFFYPPLTPSLSFLLFHLRRLFFPSVWPRTYTYTPHFGSRIGRKNVGHHDAHIIARTFFFSFSILVGH